MRVWTTMTADARDKLLVQLMHAGSAAARRSAVLKWAALSSSLSPAAELCLTELASDPDASVRSAVHRSVGFLFLRMSPFDVTDVLSRWSCDADPNVRLMLAHALSTSCSAPGAMTATALLLTDPDPRVARRAVVAAVRRRLIELPLDDPSDDALLAGAA